MDLKLEQRKECMNNNGHKTENWQEPLAMLFLNKIQMTASRASL